MSEPRRPEPSNGETDRDETPEELAELRALYRHLSPPPAADELARADAETRRVVDWMQGAWRALEPPPSAVPRLRPLRARRLRRLALAAAAVALLAGAAALWRALVRPSSPRPAEVARTPEPPLVSETTPTITPQPGVEVLVLGPDRVELRSGPVRLVLLGPPPASPEPPAPSEPPSGD